MFSLSKTPITVAQAQTLVAAALPVANCLNRGNQLF